MSKSVKNWFGALIYAAAIIPLAYIALYTNFSPEKSLLIGTMMGYLFDGIKKSVTVLTGSEDSEITNLKSQIVVLNDRLNECDKSKEILTVQYDEIKEHQDKLYEKIVKLIESKLNI